MNSFLWFGGVLIGVGAMAGLAAMIQRRVRSLLFIMVEFAGIALVVFTAQQALAGRRDEKIQRLAAEAKADTQVTYLRGQLLVTSRLVVQGQVQLAEALRVPHVRPTVAVAVTLPARAAELRGAAPADGTVVTDSVDIAADKEGLHLRLRVRHDSATAWAWGGNMWTDSLPMTVAVGCMPDGAARAIVGTPSWQPITLTALQQDPTICNPKPKWSPISLRPPSLLWTGAIVAGTLALLKIIH